MDRESILRPPITPKPMSPERVLKYKVQADIHKRFGPTFGRNYVSVPTMAFVKVMEQADEYGKLKPSHDALVIDNGFLEKDVEDLQTKLHADPVVAVLSSREDEDDGVIVDQIMEYNDEAVPNLTQCSGRSA
ncbi:unnamed protein product [Allacma fusca]|uniref:Uncharacterized protein n=1 Tax=Allacma fusca TaxID=39272 RepID=A0A8J2KP83_9HEXA|nr:unnamed protein product [Allacma fusca]